MAATSSTEATLATKRVAGDGEIGDDAKKAKLDTAAAGFQHISSFSDFKPRRVLSEDARTKFMAVEGTFGDLSDTAAVVVVEKTPFSRENYELVFTADTKLEETFHNDIYSSYGGKVTAALNGLTATVIFPATQKHVDKYLFKPHHMITETPKLYKEVTEPYIASQQLSLQWVYNILEHKKESERILFEDPDPETGFILLPDMKWDTKQPENLYVLAICHKRGIRSLRDLKPNHLPLLRNVNEKVNAALALQFGVPSHRLRGYLHYQPSYYHLHVHFSVLGFDAPGTQVERAHLLTSVIANLEAYPDYYGHATLGFTVKEGDGLHAKYKEAGYFD
ncbi:m7GpppX diphosphatase [Dermacentor andersoni]|uniref:m7GpppX diphosphatase n=1 Tax=Dermacentor andersoni TaxID=34620 RepID=UPI003B3A8EC9